MTTTWDWGAVFERARRSVTGPWVWFALAALVSLAALVKGFALEVHPYALSQYQYTYERGF